VDRGAVGFFSPTLGAVIHANGTCRDDAEASSLETLTRQLFIGYTDRQPIDSRTVTIDGRDALHSVLTARLDGVPVVLDLYVLKRNGCIFDLGYVAPPEQHARGEADFARFVAGFADERKFM
jgi:hypothetical protein